MIIIRQQQNRRIYHSLGVQIEERIIPAAGPVVDWSVWFDHFWQAKGVASYAASKNDLVGAQNLVEGNFAVPWAAGTGWGFVAGNAQWLDTQLTPANDQSWSMLVQYANVGIVGMVLAGMFSGAGSTFYLLQTNTGGGTRVQYGNGGLVAVIPQLLTGNIGIAGSQGYRDGIADGGAIGAWTGASTQSIYLGAWNNAGVATFFDTVRMRAAGIKKGPVPLTAPQVLAAVTAMALI